MSDESDLINAIFQGSQWATQNKALAPEQMADSILAMLEGDGTPLHKREKLVSLLAEFTTPGPSADRAKSAGSVGISAEARQWAKDTLRQLQKSRRDLAFWPRGTFKPEGK